MPHAFGLLGVEPMATQETKNGSGCPSVVELLNDRFRYELVTPDGKRHRANSMLKAMELGRALCATLQPGEVIQYFCSYVEPQDAAQMGGGNSEQDEERERKSGEVCAEEAGGAASAGQRKRRAS